MLLGIFVLVPIAENFPQSAAVPIRAPRSEILELPINRTRLRP